MPIKPGSLDDFGSSMAEAIEDQLDAMLIGDGLPGLPMDSSKETRDRRRLFVAIARGVVEHLEKNESSIVVQFMLGSTTVTATTTVKVSWS